MRLYAWRTIETVQSVRHVTWQTIIPTYFPIFEVRSNDRYWTRHLWITEMYVNHRSKQAKLSESLCTSASDNEQHPTQLVCIRRRTRPALEPRLSMFHCTFPSISTLPNSYLQGRLDSYVTPWGNFPRGKIVSYNLSHTGCVCGWFLP
jgi:hypothetical protein